VQGRRTWEKVGTDEYAAIQRQKHREWQLNNTGTVDCISPEPVAAPTTKKKLTLTEQRDKFLEFKRTTTKKDGTPLGVCPSIQP